MRIVVGLSGGVDSSVAAALLKEQGHEVIGVTMQLCDSKNPISGTGCFCISQLNEIDTAKRVAAELGIEHHVIDCSREYKDTILKYVDDTYLAGKTPNPCIWCNANFKFGLLPKLAEKAVGKFDKFATGHYARIEWSEKYKQYFLKKAACIEKDQSYFLSRLTQDRLSRTVFPLGEICSKNEVRKIAEKYGLETAVKKDSQDFYSGKISDLIDKDDEIGDIVDVNGKILGKHNGYWHYTIGQRKGLGISSSEPLYVIDIDSKGNKILVGNKKQAYKKEFKIDDIVWARDNCRYNGISIPYVGSCKIRSMGNTYEHICLWSDGRLQNLADNEEFFGVTKGQSAVVYLEDTVIASGIIS